MKVIDVDQVANENRSVGTAIWQICVLVTLLGAGSISRGYIFSILWEWFVSLKFGLPTLSVPEAIGIALVMAFFSSKELKENVPFKKAVKTWFSMAVAIPLVLLGFGAIVRMFG